MKKNNNNVVVDSYLKFLYESTMILSNPDYVSDSNPMSLFKKCMSLCDVGVAGSEAFHCVNKCKELLIVKQIDKLKNSRLLCDNDSCKNALKNKINSLKNKLIELK